VRTAYLGVIGVRWIGGTASASARDATGVVTEEP
jgi:hypothetical protein